MAQARVIVWGIRVGAMWPGDCGNVPLVGTDDRVHHVEVRGGGHQGCPGMPAGFALSWRATEAICATDHFMREVNRETLVQCIKGICRRIGDLKRNRELLEQGKTKGKGKSGSWEIYRSSQLHGRKEAEYAKWIWNALGDTVNGSLRGRLMRLSKEDNWLHKATSLGTGKTGKGWTPPGTCSEVALWLRQWESFKMAYEHWHDVPMIIREAEEFPHESYESMGEDFMIYILQGLEGSVQVNVTSRKVGIRRDAPIKELWNALTISAVADADNGESPGRLFMNARRTGSPCILGPKDRLILKDNRVFTNYSHEVIESLLIEESLSVTVIRGGTLRLQNTGILRVT